MPRKLAFDRMLFVVIVVLCTAGLTMVYSASAVIGAEEYGSPYHFLIRQSLAMLVGFGAMTVMMRANYRAFGRGPIVYGLFAVTVVLLVAALASPAVNDTHRWLRLGPLSLQPSELAKLVLILFLAWRLQREPKQVNNLGSTLVPCLVLTGFVIFLVARQPDLGTAISLSLIVGVMFFAAGVKVRTLAALGAAGLIVMMVVSPIRGYQLERIFAFLDPQADPLGAGYQTSQSVISVGTGGPTGRGLGEGQQKLFFLPYPYTDFIYAVIGEELGMLGTIPVVALFLILMWRGLRIAARAPDLFGGYLACGITMSLVIQAMIHVGVALGMMPAKGLPLPFVSYGGSSLVFALTASGVLLNISQYSR